MDFALNEEMEMIRDSAREYAERALKPNAAALDAAEEFPTAAIQEAAEAGFLGLTVPEEYGGAGLGNMHAAILLEEVNRWDPSVGVTISVHMSLSCSCINKWGSPEVKAKYLPKLATGELLGAYCLTEPGAGSDAGSMRTRAVKVDGGWKITGTKSWITTGPQAGLYIVYAVTDPEGRRGGNIGAFLVERAMDGVTVGKKEIKLGLRGSSTTEMIFDDVFVPDENLMGDGLNGFKIALDTLDGGRIGIAAQSLGIHRACLEESVKYSKERQQFGKPIGQFQGIAWKLADMATSLEANRMLVRHAAWLRDSGQPCTKECSMAKMWQTEMAQEVIDTCLQFFGGYGYMSEYPISRLYVDSRVRRIFGGSSEIMKLVIGRTI